MTISDTLKKLKALKTETDAAVEYKGESYEFRIRSMSGKTMAQFASIEGINLLMGTKEGDQPQSMAALYPMFQTVIPACCVNPKIISSGNPADDELLLDDLPFELISGLFEEIMKFSEMSENKETEDAIKK